MHVAFWVIRRCRHQCHIVSKQRDHVREIVGIVRAIAVDRAHDLGAGMSKTGQDAGGDSAVRLMADTYHVRMPREQLVEYLPGSVAAMVVDEDRFDLIVP